MAGTTISILGVILLLITVSYDYYRSRWSTGELEIDQSEIETDNGEIDRDKLPAIGSARDGVQGEGQRVILLGYLVSILVTTIGLAIFLEVV